MAKRRLSKEESRERFSQLRRLWNEYDPIGVMGEDWPEDEYDRYVGRTMRLLEGGAEPNEIARYLEDVCTTWMSISYNQVRGDRYAQVFVKWYRTHWNDTYV